MRSARQSAYAAVVRRGIVCRRGCRRRGPSLGTARLAALLLGLLAAAAASGPALAGTICLAMDSGGVVILKGGRIDKKPFAARVVVPGACEAAASAVAVRGEDGSVRLSVTAGPSPPCLPIFYGAITDDDLNGSGVYMVPTLGTSGSVTFTRIDCPLAP
jgi:hypothetical protein